MVVVDHPEGDRLTRIVRNLLRNVPPPPRAVARPTKSFATLREGQWIRPTRLYSGKDKIDTIHVVLATDSQGVTLAPKDGGGAFRMENRQWRDEWERVRKPAKRKGAE